MNLEWSRNGLILLFSVLMGLFMVCVMVLMFVGLLLNMLMSVCRYF